jgi:hypothetical protein
MDGWWKQAHFEEVEVKPLRNPQQGNISASALLNYQCNQESSHDVCPRQGRQQLPVSIATRLQNRIDRDIVS